MYGLECSGYVTYTLSQISFLFPNVLMIPIHIHIFNSHPHQSCHIFCVKINISLVKLMLLLHKMRLTSWSNNITPFIDPNPSCMLEGIPCHLGILTVPYFTTSVGLYVTIWLKRPQILSWCFDITYFHNHINFKKCKLG